MKSNKESIWLTRIVFAIFGAVIGCTFGLIVMWYELDCYGPSIHTLMCGLASYIFNMPASMIAHAIVPDGILYEGAWTAAVILFVDCVIFGIAGSYASGKQQKYLHLFIYLLALALSLAVALPLLMFLWNLLA